MMAEHLFTTSLYVFSSLVQADAAILSLGAIFIIYRLQTMDSSYHNALASLSSDAFAGNLGQHANRIAVSRSDPERAGILVNFQGSFFLSFLETVAYTGNWKRKLINQSTFPFLLLAIHCAISAILFLRAPMFTENEPTEFRIWITVDVAAFVGFLFFIVSRAYKLLTFDPSNRTETFENIDRQLPLTYTELRLLFPSDLKRFMYRFMYKGKQFYVLIYSKRKDLFSLNFLTYSEAERRILSQKSVDDKSDAELEVIWIDFLNDEKKYLQPK